MVAKSMFAGLFGVLLTVHGLSQTNAPQIVWQRVHGGTAYDECFAILSAGDGNYFLGGHSNTGVSGNKTSGNIGGYDYWLLKVDEHGSNLWDRTFGGTDNEYLTALAAAADGGCYLVGNSLSGTSGNKSVPNFGASSTWDVWLVRVDASGNKIWDRSYGGSGNDAPWGMASTRDQGLVIMAGSRSPADGNKTAQNFGMDDLWVVRLDADGNVIWDKTFGGAGSDMAGPVIQLRDGGFLVGGSSSSEPSGNKTSPHYDPPSAPLPYDYWVVRLDSDGNKLWDQTFGGSGFDLLAGLLQDKEGNLFLIGSSSSPPDGNKTSPFYDSGQSHANLTDYWIVKLDEQGNKLWDRSFGGTFSDRCYKCIQTADGNYLACGTSDSLINGTKTTPRFGQNLDGWLVRFDGEGNQLWDMSLGGEYGEGIYSLLQAEDGGYLVPAFSSSGVYGNKTVPGYSGNDFWLVKLRPDTLNLRPVSRSTGDIQTTGFQLRLSAPTNTYVLDYSTNLDQWHAFQTNVLTSNSVVIADMDATNSPQRFYRARVANP